MIPTDRKTRSCQAFPQLIHKQFCFCWNRCARLIIFGNIPVTYSTSSSVDSRPREKRTSEFASLRAAPKASKTCEGSSDPAEQAEPLEAQIPSRSKPAKREILSEP